MTGPLANDLRVGRILSAAPAEGLRNPSNVLEIHLGPELRSRRSCAQLTVRDQPEELIGRLVVCAWDLGTRQIGAYTSEVLATGVDSTDATGELTLLWPNSEAIEGSRVS